MRIVHISDCYPPRTGGIESQVHALARRQLAAGDDVHVLTATAGTSVTSGPDTVDGVPVLRITARIPGGLPVHPRAGRHLTQSLRSALADGGVDAVHIHAGVVSPFAWSAVRASTALGLPTLVTVHCVWGPGAAPAYRVGHALTGWADWGAQLAGVSSMAAGRIARVRGTGEVLVLPNGIDPDEWRVVPARDPQAGLRAVTVMRLAPRKRAVPLVRMLREARQGPPPVDLSATIVGDGPTRAAAERAARAAGRGTITFTGRLDRDGIRGRFAEADVFVLPSVREAFGLAALEARAAGLPVIARAQTGVADFITDGVDGLLVADDAAMVDAIRLLAQDRALLERLTASARASAPAQQWPAVLQMNREAYAVAAQRARRT